MRGAGVEGGKPAPDGRARAPPARPREAGEGAAPPLHGSAAGPPRPPHSPRPRPRAAAAVTAVVPAAATAAAPTAAAAPDDNRAAILGALRQRRKAALRQRRKAAPACGTATRSRRRLRWGFAPAPCARRKRASAVRGPRGSRWPLRPQRREGLVGRAGIRGRKGCWRRASLRG